MKPLSLYLHLPFCLRKCAYCSFNSIVAPENVRRDYLQALQQEISRQSQNYNERPLATIYFGGGTPTIYPAADLQALLQKIRQCFSVLPEAEISLEANPETISLDKLYFLRQAGFNRISIGIQSLHDDELQLLGRIHTAQQAKDAVVAAREAGFDNLSVDLINCLPGQTKRKWLATLSEVLTWKPAHISCYGLIIEPNTPLAQCVATGQIKPLSAETASEIYALTHKMLTESGYEHYEIANYCLPGYRCRHNENYWRYGEYLGLGAGATSFVQGCRFTMEPNPHLWLQSVRAGLAPPLAQKEFLSPEQRAFEKLMLALRTSEGIDWHSYCSEMDVASQQYEPQIKALITAGLAYWKGQHLCLTPARGFLLHSEIVQLFMS